MITREDLLSIGIIRRTRYRDLPPFVFVQRDGLFVPFRSEEISDLIGEEGFLLRSDVQEEGDGELTWQDLVGYTVEDQTAGTVGVIAHVDEQTINTLATLEDGRMMPLHEDFITDIDTDNRVLHVNLPFAL
jgi:ribosomal 30S subunit maturation factor RimM